MSRVNLVQKVEQEREEDAENPFSHSLEGAMFSTNC